MKPIDLSKVTHTRCGYEVLEAHFFQKAHEAGEGYPISATVKHKDGILVIRSYTIDGLYFQNQHNPLDLVTEELAERGMA